MNTKTLSTRALSVIDQYLHFQLGSGVCSVPYFNNKTLRRRGTLRVLGGKGSPKDIYDEVYTLLVKDHVSLDTLSDEALKKILTDNNIGIDCSGFAYYILNAESEELKKGSLGKHLHFMYAHGVIGFIASRLSPEKNTDVATFADNKNSRVILTSDINPGDMITMTAVGQDKVRNHILIIHQVEYQNFVPIVIHYSHSVAYPEDGVYGSGIHQGTITILDQHKPITEQQWSEGGTSSQTLPILLRARQATTEVRRLRWW